MKAVNVKDKAGRIATLGLTVVGLVGDADLQAVVDEHADQSWFGLTDQVCLDLDQAYDLLILASNKLNTIQAGINSGAGATLLPV